MSGLRGRIRRWLDPRALPRLERAVIEVASLAELNKVFDWRLDPVLDDPSIPRYEYLEDVNLRRLRDAESLGAAARNGEPSLCVDIGTGRGHSAALIAVNAPQARVLTINAPPEEIDSGRAGRHTTMALGRDEIGAYYRERGLGNVTQLFANTSDWRPGPEPIDLAFVDGSHDAGFVFDDTRKVLTRMAGGGFVLWHDFNPSLAPKYPWILEVCRGVEALIGAGLVRGRILHLRDSWTGIYRLP